MIWIKRLLPLVVGLVCFGQVWQWTRAPKEARTGVSVTLTVTTPMSDEFELFYDTTGQGFGPSWSARASAQASLEPQDITFRLPAFKDLHGLRIDPADHAVEMAISRLTIDGPYRRLIWNEQEIFRRFTRTNDVDTIWFDAASHTTKVKFAGGDPFLATDQSIRAVVQPTLSTLRPSLLSLLQAALAGSLVAILLAWVLTWKQLPLNGANPLRGSSPVSLLLVGIASIAVFMLARAFLSQIKFKDHPVELVVAGEFLENDEFQVYQALSQNEFKQESVLSRDIIGDRGLQLLQYQLPKEPTVHFLRFDPGNRQDSLWIDSISIAIDDNKLIWHAKDLVQLLTPNSHIAEMRVVNDRVFLKTNGVDPYLVVNMDIAPAIDALHEASGNGPIPTGIAVIVALFFLLGTGRAMAVHHFASDIHAKELTIIIGFGVIVMAPFITGLTDTDPQLANTEKRLLAEEPPFTLARTLVYPTEYTRYYEENFGLRKLYFRWNSLFASKVLLTSPLPDKVIFGKNGWMFYVQPHIMKKYEGLCDLTRDQLRSIADRLEQRRQWLERQGMSYILMFPPEKSVVYGDELPWRIKQFNGPSCLDILKEEISQRTKLVVVDVRQELRDARRMGDVYYTTDTHWNPVGAWYGYCGLMNAIRSIDSSVTPPVPFDRYTIEKEVNPMGDLAELLGLADAFPRTTPHMTPLDVRYARDTTISGSVARYTRYMPIIKYVPGSKAPRLLMFRDSFTVYMIPNLSEHFSRSSYVWTPIFFHEVVQEEKPDIIVHEVMELFLSDLLQDDREVPDALFP